MSTFDYIDRAIEQHYIGNLLSEDEGFSSWNSDLSKPSINDPLKSVLGDVKNSIPYYYEPQLALNHSFTSFSSPQLASPTFQTDTVHNLSPTSSPSSKIKFNVNAPEFIPSSKFTPASSPSMFSTCSSAPDCKPCVQSADDQFFTPVSQKKKAPRIKDENADPPLSGIIGLNPVRKSNRKDVIAREHDFAKVTPRKKDPAKQSKAAGLDKSRASPTKRSSSNENLPALRKGKFQVLNQLSDKGFGGAEDDSCGEVKSSLILEARKAGKNTALAKSRPTMDEGVPRALKAGLMIIIVIFVLGLVANYAFGLAI